MDLGEESEENELKNDDIDLGEESEENELKKDMVDLNIEEITYNLSDDKEKKYYIII